MELKAQRVEQGAQDSCKPLNPLHGVERYIYVSKFQQDIGLTLRIRYMELKEHLNLHMAFAELPLRNPLHGVESLALSQYFLLISMNPLHGVESVDTLRTCGKIISYMNPLHGVERHHKRAPG